MAYFRLNPTNTAALGGGVTIAAASTGDRARFLYLSFSNAGTSQRVLRIYDGATLRVELALSPGAGDIREVPRTGQSIFPKVWWTSGNTITADLDASGDVRIFGEIVREP